MQRAALRRLSYLPLLLVGALTGCGGPAKPAGDPYTEAAGQAHAMTLEEASKVAAEAMGDGSPASTVTIASLADVETLIREDRTTSFGQVLSYLEGQPGPAPRALRAFTLISRGEIQRLVARVLGDQARRKASDLRRLQQREAEGAPFNAEDKARKESLDADVKRITRLETALDMVSKPALRDGVEVAHEALKQSPTDKIAPVALAHAYAVTGDWLAFDGVMAKLEKSESIPGAITYLRAAEQADRYSRPDRARELLVKTRAEAPRFVRAEVRLVLLQETVDTTAAEMEKLCGEAPYHVLCRLGLHQVRQVQQVESTSSAPKP